MSVYYHIIDKIVQNNCNRFLKEYETPLKRIQGCQPMKIKPLVHGRYFHEHFGKIIAHQAEAYLEPI